MIAIGISTTPIFVRLTRGQVISVKVEIMSRPPAPWAIHAGGCAVPYPAQHHAGAIGAATLSICAAIIAEAALSFLGLGQQPPAPSWGSMLNAAQRFLTKRAMDGESGRGWQFSSWCCRSTWSATACATRSIQGSASRHCERSEAIQLPSN